MILLFLLLTFLLASTSCESVPEPKDRPFSQVNGRIEARTTRGRPPGSDSVIHVEHNQELTDIQILVRDFLKGKENREFGYFVYLIFTEQSDATYPQRLAAAKAFICQHSNVSEAYELGLQTSHLAVFYAPITYRTNVVNLRRSTKPNDLLRAYNYTLGKVLLGKLIKRNPSAEEKLNFTVGIIGSPTPLVEINENTDSPQLQILALDKDNPYQIARRIRAFRKGLTTQAFNNHLAGYVDSSNFASKMRNFFYSVGSVIYPESASTEDSEHACV